MVRWLAVSWSSVLTRKYAYIIVSPLIPSTFIPAISSRWRDGLMLRMWGRENQTQQVDFASVTQRNRYGCLAGIYAKRKNAPNGAF